ncbi:MAG TPA: ATPase, T2SS/T4P/T4SS family, partial [Pirellulales bacterium]
SLTGHMVFSTLHTNDAAGAYTRLVDMGVEPFLVASTVEGIMAQRLVRTLCPECKKPWSPSRDELPHDFPWDTYQSVGLPLYLPGGCRTCRNLGYKGRLGIYELLITTEKVRALAQERASSWAVKQAAMSEGMRTLRVDGWNKVLSGRTSVEEILRATKSDTVAKSLGPA